MQDWKRWIDLKIVDELIVQIYRKNLNSFISELNRRELQDARTKIPTAVAILSGLRNNPVPINLIENKIRQARRYNFGISFFYYETLWRNQNYQNNDLRKAVVRSLFYYPQPRL